MRAKHEEITSLAPARPKETSPLVLLGVLMDDIMWCKVVLILACVVTCQAQQGHELSDQCGEHSSFQGPSGTILVPPWYNGDKNYPANTDCTYNIQVYLGQIVLLSFQEFELENKSTKHPTVFRRSLRKFQELDFRGEEEPVCHDFVRVYDGDSRTTDPPPLGPPLCGIVLPGDVVSTGNVMTVKFYSDYSLEYSGFNATYQAVVLPPILVGPTSAVAVGEELVLECVANYTFESEETYQFYKDGNLIPGDDRSTQTYRKQMTDSDVGEYTCSITLNGITSAASAPVTVDVKEVTTPAKPNTTTIPTMIPTATTKKPGLSPEMKVTVAIQLIGFAAGLFGLLAMCIPVVFVFLRNVYLRKMQKEEGIEQDEGEDGDGEGGRKVHWELPLEAGESSVDVARESSVDAAKSPDTLTPRASDETSEVSESPRVSVISRLFGSDIFVPRLSGSQIVSPSPSLTPPTQQSSI